MLKVGFKTKWLLHLVLHLTISDLMVVGSNLNNCFEVHLNSPTWTQSSTLQWVNTDHLWFFKIKQQLNVPITANIVKNYAQDNYAIKQFAVQTLTGFKPKTSYLIEGDKADHLTNATTGHDQTYLPIHSMRLICNKKLSFKGISCGSVSRTVVTNTIDSRFYSKHWQKFTIFKGTVSR